VERHHAFSGMDSHINKHFHLPAYFVLPENWLLSSVQSAIGNYSEPYESITDFRNEFD